MDGQMDRSVLRAAWSQLKIQYDHQAAILKVMSVKNKMFLPTATSTQNLKLKFQSKLELCSRNHATYRVYKWLSLKINRLLKLGVDIQSQTEVRVRKPKNPIWPPGGHFETDVAEKQWAFLPMATINMQMKFEIEIPKQTPKTMLSTDRQTDRQDESSIHTPIQLHWVGV